jgi:hypothetical protein
MLNSMILCVLLILSLNVVSSLYMSIDMTPKCMLIDKPRDTPISFLYEVIDAGNVVYFDLYYGNAMDPKMSILHKELSTSSGSIDYVTDVDGNHLYCIYQKSLSADLAKTVIESAISGKGLNTSTRFKVLVNYGHADAHYQALAKERDFDSVNLDMRKLNDMMDLAINEADYQKYKEMEYHDETEAMNAATLWWPIAQIGILIIVGVFQVKHLKTFFKTNKLI